MDRDGLKGDIVPELNRLRQEIDTLDQDIVRLIARRFDIVRRVAALKSRHGVPAVLPGRIEEVRERAAAMGADAGLNPDFMRRFYADMIAEACALEERHLAAEDTTGD